MNGSADVRVICRGTSLVVQWLRPCASTTGGVGLTFGQGTKIPCTMHHGQKISGSQIQLVLWYFMGLPLLDGVLVERRVEPISKW